MAWRVRGFEDEKLIGVDKHLAVKPGGEDAEEEGQFLHGRLKHY